MKWHNTLSEVKIIVAQAKIMYLSHLQTGGMTSTAFTLLRIACLSWLLHWMRQLKPSDAKIVLNHMLLWWFSRQRLPSLTDVTRDIHIQEGWIFPHVLPLVKLPDGGSSMPVESWALLKNQSDHNCQCDLKHVITVVLTVGSFTDGRW